MSAARMQGRFRWVVPAIIFAFTIPALTAAPRSLVATVQHVADGDSVTAISDNGTKLRIRLLGIDAPEVAHNGKPGQPFGDEARDYLDHLIGGKTIRVDAYGPDQYKRILGVIWDDQVNVNLLMVAMGYAEVYRGAPCQVYCEELRASRSQGSPGSGRHVGARGQVREPAAFRRRVRLSGK